MRKIKSHKTFGGYTEFFSHNSKSTSSSMNFSWFRPEREIRGGLLVLSGLTCTEENFIMKAGTQRFASELGLVLMCPDTSPRGLGLPGEKETIYFGEGAGLYVDAIEAPYSQNYQMFSYVNTELYELVNETFNLAGNVSIMGHSMGGHGALVAALRFPEKYKSVSALAPITNPTQSEWTRAAFEKYLGVDRDLWLKYDACELLKAGNQFPHSILIDQGLEDESLDRSLLVPHFERAAKESSQKVEVRYHTGYDHSYYFVSTFVEDHLRFHSGYLRGE